MRGMAILALIVATALIASALIALMLINAGLGPASYQGAPSGTGSPVTGRIGVTSGYPSAVVHKRRSEAGNLRLPRESLTGGDQHGGTASQAGHRDQ